MFLLFVEFIHLFNDKYLLNIFYTVIDVIAINLRDTPLLTWNLECNVGDTLNKKLLVWLVLQSDHRECCNNIQWKDLSWTWILGSLSW